MGKLFLMSSVIAIASCVGIQTVRAEDECKKSCINENIKIINTNLHKCKGLKIRENSAHYEHDIEKIRMCYSHAASVYKDCVKNKCSSKP
ncbi:hypothetical protein Bealeia1_00590 [Candidatus Bealeia paramacronuclearis]|uniref:Uncharacterized protein n=1 Tax=Candidatus Bealeia paramacronuclearis TaxID=1921001 RepID=A0ABZ2C2E6_9PROT|nr:hypothetical protein [Candidatus Bealeia paramacronuclearis]